MLGEDHPETLISAKNLALILQRSTATPETSPNPPPPPDPPA
ncbi:hypothetical protein [Streptomyces sp. NPDC056949]